MSKPRGMTTHAYFEHRGHRFFITTWRGATVGEFAAALFSMLDIPAASQHLLFDSGVRVSPSEMDDQFIELVGQFSGPFKLLGLPRSELNIITEAVALIHTESRPESLEELNTVADRAVRRRWFEKVPTNLDQDMKLRLTALVGIGYFPRLACSHSTSTKIKSCHGCSSCFIMEMFITVLKDKKRRAIAQHLATTHGVGVVMPVDREVVWLEASVLAGQTGLLADAITEYLWYLDLDPKEESIEIAGDLNAFQQALDLLNDHVWEWDEQSSTLSPSRSLGRQSASKVEVSFGSLTIKNTDED